jgi:hypothetical protein
MVIVILLITMKIIYVVWWWICNGILVKINVNNVVSFNRTTKNKIKNRKLIIFVFKISF